MIEQNRTHKEFDRLLGILNSHECVSVTLHHANPDFNGLPDHCISAEYYLGEDLKQEFRDDEFATCLAKANDWLEEKTGAGEST